MQIKRLNGILQDGYHGSITGCFALIFWSQGTRLMNETQSASRHWAAQQIHTRKKKNIVGREEQDGVRVQEILSPRGEHGVSLRRESSRPILEMMKAHAAALVTWANGLQAKVMPTSNSLALY